MEYSTNYRIVVELYQDPHSPHRYFGDDDELPEWLQREIDETYNGRCGRLEFDCVRTVWEDKGDMITPPAYESESIVECVTMRIASDKYILGKPESDSLTDLFWKLISEYEVEYDILG
jgi:hypothetical protein